jgi:uncharacterized membrane protein YphA (DoxX/SURF4 family)
MTTPQNKARTAARITLGLIFAVFGLNGFLNFIPQPPHGGAAGEFLGALAANGYMFPLVKAVELATGILLLAGRYVPLALTLLAPVVVNIVAFHLFLEPASIAVPLVALALGVYLAWTERSAYAPLFVARSRSEKATLKTETLGSHATTAV